MSELPPQLRDRSIKSGHNGILITWIPRDQLVPISTRYTDTVAGPPPCLTVPQNPLRYSKKKSTRFSTSKKRQEQKPNSQLTLPREARFMNWLAPMQRLKAFWSSPPIPTKAVTTGEPSLRKKDGFWDLWGRTQSSGIIRRRSSRFLKLACEGCKKKAARGERVRCFNYLCRGCGENAVSVVRDDQGFCGDCANTRGAEGNGRTVEEVVSPLDGPSVLGETEVLRGERVIEGSTMSCSNHSTDAAIGAQESQGDTHPERNPVSNERSLKVRRGCHGLKLQLSKLCGDGDWGTVTNDGVEIETNTCSDDSLVLVNVDREPVEYCAAQIGSPTGGTQSFWPSHYARAKEAADAGSSMSLGAEQPKLHSRRSTELSSVLQDAIHTPICPHGIAVPPNSHEDEALQSTATSRPIAISKRSLELRDRINELENLPAYTRTWHESPPFQHWKELLEHPSSPSSSEQSLLAPSPTLADQSSPSTDSFYSVPQSLEDSEYCSDLVRVLSTGPDRPEDARDLTASTPPPISPHLCQFPSEPGRKDKDTRHSIESERNESPASTASTLLFDSTYFEKEQQSHPHPHSPRTPSPAYTPYPSLNSSIASLGSSYVPTVENIDSDPATHRPTPPTEFHSSLEGDIEATIHPPGCTPPLRPHSPGLKQWSNESVSLLGTTPECAFVSGGKYDAGNQTAVEIRGGGRKAGGAL